MPDIILHHYKFSPFSEKIRLALGLKGLSWRSVEISPAPPRPWLTPLTGGYRRVPVLQIGADIYCDTNIILPTLDRLYSTPTLYPAPFGTLAQALSYNWEQTIWLPAIGVLVHFVGDLPPDFLKDRKESYLYVDISKDAMEPEFDRNVQRLRAQLAWVKATLADGRRFLCGETPGALDLGYYHVLWLIRQNGPKHEVDNLLGLTPLLAWLERVGAIGQGTPSDLDAEAALKIARNATPVTFSHIEPGAEPSRLQPGSSVTVTPIDTAKVPVAGTLVAAGGDEVIIHRDDEQAGNLHLHFPRAGFEVKAA